jgi:hypothetical protein
VIIFLVPARGAFSVENYLALDPPALSNRFRVIRYEDLPGLREFPRGTWVLAGLDQLTAGQLRLVSELHAQMSHVAGTGFLNHPTRTLRRFDLLHVLHAQGRNEFRAVRAGDEFRGLRFPVFLRQERDHGGAVSPLLHSPGEVDRAIGRALIRGHSFQDLLVVEFCSTLCADGIYRKYSAFIVGNRIMGRSLDHGTQWMLKFGGVEYLTQPLILEEQAYVMDNPHREQLAEIFAVAGVEYGRIDYSIKDGRVQTWEINLNATIGRGTGPTGGIGPREWWPIRDATREYFFDRFREAWAEVDRQTAGPAVAIEFGRETRSGATQPLPADRRPLERAQALLRPFKRFLEPLSGPLYRMIGIASRRVRRPAR